MLCVYNVVCWVGMFDYMMFDDCCIEGVYFVKIYWVCLIDMLFFFGYVLCFGIMFMYFGFKVNECVQVYFGG